MKKVLTLILVLVMLFSITACAEKKKNIADISIDKLELGKDYKDIKADIKVITHRTDIVDTVLADYVKEFQKLYPNVKITYEAITDYSQTITTRLTTPNWGDICMIPGDVDKPAFSTYFISFGDQTKLSEKYIFLNDKSFDGKVYGIPSTNNVQGIVFNKAVFTEAGITSMPKTPDEFLSALQLIKDNTDAIPLYTNFAAGWTMGAWDAYIGGTSDGDANYMNQVLPHAKNPFADRGDGTGPYAVYYSLYEAVKRGLIEEDPTTTDWEGCKAMINNGEIGTMVLGSWAVSQMQQAGPNPDNIGYMPFPISVNGVQYASAGPDYCYGINVHSSVDNQIASMLYVKWLTEVSNFAFDQGGIPEVKDAALPATLTTFEGIEFVANAPALEGEETLLGDINTESEVAINNNNDRVASIVSEAFGGGKTLKELTDEWNAKWTAAQETLGVTVN
ncbi:MAG: ABC transporter substrate-binding protein [Oscillospiraceae bacterium]|jgi:ABC-type glycerol-3-phosphate transport system substrate-binding protein|nr:ABC transporter substrate-binding protein [Oscillospiraceae bacterium]